MFKFFKKIYKPLFCFCLCFFSVFVLIGCLGGQTNDTSSGKKSGKRSSALHQEMAIGSEAPDFTAKLNNGETFTLSDKKGQVILLNFWATWCSNCVKEMPAIEKLYEEYGDQIVIVGVNVGEDEDTIDTFIEAKNYSFPVACDTESNISNLYPTCYRDISRSKRCGQPVHEAAPCFTGSLRSKLIHDRLQIHKQFR